MTNDDMTDAARHRLDLIETRMMHQEQMIEDLNETITAQWRLTEGLARRISQLEERLLDISASGRETLEPPPPHY